MCMSTKITGNRIHLPKARAALMREWLRLLSQQGVDLMALEKQLPQQCLSFRGLANDKRMAAAAAGETRRIAV